MSGFRPFRSVPFPRPKRSAEQRSDNITESGTTAKTTDTDRRREEKQARKARFKAKHPGTHQTDRCITVNSGKEQRRNPERRAKKRNDSLAGSSIAVVPQIEHPQGPEQQAEQRNDNVPNHFTSSVKMFYELPRPSKDEPRTWAWQLRMLVFRSLILTFEEYCKIDWEIEFDFQKFQAECVESDPCYIHRYRGKRRVPIACSKHSMGTNLMWRRRDEELREQLDARFAAEEEEREAVWVEESERIKRAVAESPDLWILDKLWKPVGPGVALITSTLLKDVATFFCDCDITVWEANLWTEDRRYTKEGRDIVAQIQSGSDEIEWSTREQAQVRITIDKFRQPGHVRNLEHLGHAAVRNPKGQYGNALCAVILFLGRTGRPVPDKIDDQCYYWIYSASGFSGGDLSKLGQEAPFRMVRLSKVSHRDHHDIMMRFDLRTGKKRAKAFSDGFNRKVKRVEVDSFIWQGFRLWKQLPEDLEPVGSIEDDDPGEDDPSGDDIGGEDAGENDPGEYDTAEEYHGGDGPAEDDPMDNMVYVGARDSGSLSGLTDDGYQSDEEGDESDNGFQWPVPGMKSNIPGRLRAGAKI